MGQKDDRPQHEQPHTAPGKRFRIEKVEERIVPKKRFRMEKTEERIAPSVNTLSGSADFGSGGLGSGGHYNPHSKLVGH